MPYLNEAKIMGHLTGEAEVNEVGESLVSNFTVAINRGYGENKTDFVDVKAWNRGNYEMAKYTESYEKGDLILVVGEFRQERWEGENGQRSKVVVRADELYNFSDLFRNRTDNSSGGGDDEEEIPF